MAMSDPLLDAGDWDDENNRPKYASYCINILNQERRSIESLLQEARRLMEERPESHSTSPFIQDLELVVTDKFLEAPFEHAVEQFRRLTSAASEYTAAFTLLLKHDQLMIQASWGLVRGAMEAVLTLAWFIEASKTSDMRAARALSLLPAIAEGGIKAASKFPTAKEQVAEKRELKADVIKYYQKHGVEIVWGRDKDKQPTDEAVGIVYKGKKAAFSRNVTQMASWYLPDSPQLYPLLSGAAHSEAWRLNGIQPESLGEALNSVVMPLLEISQGYINAVSSYFGIDPSPYLTGNTRRLMGLMMRGGTSTPTESVSTAFGLRGSGLPHEFAGQRPSPSSLSATTEEAD